MTKKYASFLLIILFVSTLKSNLLGFQGLVFETQEEVENKILFEGLKSAKTEDDSLQVFSYLVQLSINYSTINFNERGKEFADRAVRFSKEIGNDSLRAQALNALAITTRSSAKYQFENNEISLDEYLSRSDSAIQIFKKRISLLDKRNDQTPKLYSYKGIARIYRKTMEYRESDYDKAIQNIDKAVELAEIDGDINNYFETMLLKIVIMRDNVGHNETLELLLGLQDYLDRNNFDLEDIDLMTRHAYYGHLVNVHLKILNRNDILDLVKLFNRTNEKRWLLDYNESIADMDRQYETSFTQEQLAQQEELNQLQQAQISQRNLILGVIALLLFGSVSGGVFFYRLNGKNKRLAENNALLVKEQNHRVKNNLQMISSLLSLQANQVEGESKENMLDGSRRVQAIALLHRKLYDDLEGVKEVNIKEFAEELVEDLLFASGKQHIPVKLNLEPVTLPVEKSVHLALILNELITNSIKHVFSKPQLNGECLELSITEKASEVLVQYRDNSGSFDEKGFESSDSLGNQIIRSQSKYLSKNWSIKNAHGFSYQLTIS